MEYSKTIHLENANTLSNFLTQEERVNVVSLKITGFLGRKDFEDVLNNMCDSWGEFDDNDDYTPDYDLSPSLRHLDMGDATYVDGASLPYFGFHTLLETVSLPQGIKSTTIEDETALSYAENLRTLILPAGLKTVGGFNSCPKLTGLVLPEGLKTIESFAFCGCEGIKTIRIPASVEYISGSSFADCHLAVFEIDESNPNYTVIDGVLYSKDLKTLVAFPSAYPNKHFIVPNTTVVIGEHAFSFSKITSIELPGGLTTINEWAFNASHIRSIHIPDTVTKIGEGTFQFCLELEQVELPAKLDDIPRETFVSCPKLKELVVPYSVRTIHYSALIWSHGIERLVLQDGLEEIVDDGPMVVSAETIKDVVLPKTLKKVPGGVFNYSPHIKSFNLDPENPFFRIIDDALCSKDGKELFSVPNYYREGLYVPEGVEVIKERAFAYLPKLNSVNLPSTLRIIESRVFQGDDSLKSITIPAAVVKVDMDALWADNLKTVVMESSLPPEMTGYVKNDDWRYKQTILFVPSNAVSAYKEASGWKSFIVKPMKN